MFVGGGAGAATGAGGGGGGTHGLGGTPEHGEVLVDPVILGHLLLGVVYPHVRGRSVGIAVGTDGPCGIGGDPVSIHPLLHGAGTVGHITGGLLKCPGVHLVLSVIMILSRWSGILCCLGHVSRKMSEVVAISGRGVSGLEHVGVFLTQNHRPKKVSHLLIKNEKSQKISRILENKSVVQYFTILQYCNNNPSGVNPSYNLAETIFTTL